MTVDRERVAADDQESHLMVAERVQQIAKAFRYRGDPSR
jgi:hypothetical protein